MKRKNDTTSIELPPLLDPRDSGGLELESILKNKASRARVGFCESNRDGDHSEYQRELLALSDGDSTVGWGLRAEHFMAAEESEKNQRSRRTLRILQRLQRLRASASTT